MADTVSMMYMRFERPELVRVASSPPQAYKFCNFEQYDGIKARFTGQIAAKRRFFLLDRGGHRSDRGGPPPKIPDRGGRHRGGPQTRQDAMG